MKMIFLFKEKTTPKYVSFSSRWSSVNHSSEEGRTGLPKASECQEDQKTTEQRNRGTEDQRLEDDTTNRRGPK